MSCASDISIKELAKMDDASKYVRYVFYYWYKKYLNYEIDEKSFCHILADFLDSFYNNGAKYDISNVTEKMFRHYCEQNDIWERPFFLQCYYNISKMHLTGKEKGNG